ncbi:MAG TPA: pilus assembly protein PilM [Paenibacillus sp.]|jgi:type IV pilus assembly protein PilM
MFGIGKQWVGIAIEQTGIRYVRLNKKKTWEIDKKCYLPLVPGMIIENQIADGQALQDLLKLWVKRENLKGGKISLSIPPSQIIIRRMSIPSTNPKQVKELVKLEVETGLHLPFDNPVYDYVTTELDEENTHLLVFAAPHKLIEDYVAVLEYAGMKVSSVELSATAIARTLAVTYEEIFEETMLIHLEQSLLDVYMFRSGHPVFMRTINLYDLHQEDPIKLTQIDESSSDYDVGTEDFLSPEQIVEITAEISRMLNFYQYSLHDGSTRITDMIITGPTESRMQLLDELTPIMIEQNVRAISFDNTVAMKYDPDMNDYRNAIGTALKKNGSFAIDLLPREDREAQVFPYVAMGLSLIWVVGFIGIGITYAGNHGQISRQTVRIEALNNQSTMLEQELTALQANGTQGKNTKTVIDELMKYRIDAVDVLDELDGQLPEGGVIRDISYTHHSEIALTINFVNMDDAAAYLVKLRKMSFSISSMLEKLTLESTTPRSDAQTLESSEATSIRMYSAIFRVDMNQPKVAPIAQAGQEGEDVIDGTNK